MKGLLSEFKPDRIFHLAAQSYPTVSWEDPWYTIETNVIGTINIFEGIKELGLDCKILNACSSAEYGFVSQEEVPLKGRTFTETAASLWGVKSSAGDAGIPVLYEFRNKIDLDEDFQYNRAQKSK